MSVFSSLDIGASGLTANRLWMDTISSNIANINTTRTAEGGPYKRQVVAFTPKGDSGGVRVSSISQYNGEPRLGYDPGHPDADTDGYVAMPDINIVIEMVNMVSATRAYEANVTVMSVAKSMFLKALEI
ncbi:MAG: flagellar basal body rod protein FlgC [Actinomycetota bacterium]|nr:flagellar basal body rod protein FlgC [Actinomycetota bacterium]